MVKDLPAMQETQVRSLSWGDSLEKGMATHFSIFAWRIPWTEEPGGLQSLGSQRVRRDWVTNSNQLTNTYCSYCSYCSWQNNRILNEELPRSVGVQYATGDQWKNNSRENEGMESKQKQYPVVDVTGDRSKNRCYRNLECQVHESRQIGSGQKDMARVNVDILGISKLK